MARNCQPGADPVFPSQYSLYLHGLMSLRSNSGRGCLKRQVESLLCRPALLQPSGLCLDPVNSPLCLQGTAVKTGACSSRVCWERSIKRNPGSPSLKIRKEGKTQGSVEGKEVGAGLEGSRGPKRFSFFMCTLRWK